MRRLIALADAGALGLLQNLRDFLDGEELGNPAEANVVSDPAASRQLRQSAGHGLSLAMPLGRCFRTPRNVIRIRDQTIRELSANGLIEVPTLRRRIEECLVHRRGNA